MINIKTLVDAYVPQVDGVDFNLAADVNNVQSALDALAYSALNQAGFANVQTLSGNLTLTDDSAVLHVLDPGGANRDVTLPAVANTNHPYYFVNDDPTYTLTIKNAGGTTIATVTDGLIKLVTSDGTAWYATGASGNIGSNFVLSGVISPSQITGDQNNYNPTGLSSASTLRLSTDASRNITGLAGGAIGRIILIHNVGSFPLVLKDESGSSTAANRFALSGDATLFADQSIALQYDSTTSRWRMVGVPPPVAATPVSGVDGFTLTNNGSDPNNDIDIGPGFVMDSTYVYPLRTIATLTKRLDATFTAGNNGGGLDTGAAANNTFYYVWVIRKDSDSTIDFLFSTSNSSPTLPSGYSISRFTGWSFRTNGSAQIYGFIHVGNRFYYKSPPGLEVDTTSLSTTRTNSTRSFLPAQRVVAVCNVHIIRASANTQVYFSNPDLTDLATSLTVTPLSTTGHNNNFSIVDQVDILTDASGVFSFVAAGASTTLRVAPIGWIVP